jgi:capsule biosynthesis phosphatase
MKTFIFDLDNTITIDSENKRSSLAEDIEYYENVKPNIPLIERIRLLYNNYRIVIQTARGMKTCGGNVDLIKNRVGNVTIDWLRKHNVPYDEIVFGKPYGDGFYVDDKACISIPEEITRRFRSLEINKEKEYLEISNKVLNEYWEKNIDFFNQ